MNKTHIPLSRLYPLSERYLILLILPWALAAFAVIAIIGITDIERPFLGQDARFFFDANQEGILLLGGILLVLLLRYLYLQAYRHSFRYEIVGKTLYISRGVFVRQSGSLFLPRVSDIYIGRTPVLFFFGLCFVEILTPTEESRNFFRIEGLTKRGAEGLRRKIFECISQAERALRSSQPIYYGYPSRPGAVPGNAEFYAPSS